MNRSILKLPHAMAGVFILATLAAGCAGQTSSGTSSSSSETTAPNADQTTSTANDSIVPGSYQCSTLSGGALQAAASENFTIVDSQSYRDASGTAGSYTVGGDLITFQGGALDGKQAMYTAGAVHSANPPSIAFLLPDGNPGDTCQPR